ncbi:MAG: divalent-cation tolerance protein CutA [Polyangiaceae bacterium]|nr:divalent-cation tolerance protein CutA [Polyangiaceae bacterium]
MSFVRDDSVRVLVSTAPSEEVAARIARALVERRLVACVNLVPRVRSVYRWQGEVHDDAETLMLMKTTPARAPEVAEALRELHPYECPELIELGVEGGLAAYLAWVAGATT